jgi:uncharacterized protein (TIGR02186 family)
LTGRRQIHGAATPLVLLTAVLLSLTVGRASAAPPLVTDLSSHLISVTSDFTGTDLLLFGSVLPPVEQGEEQLPDIIVVVRGPEFPMTVRRKDRIAGIWVNADAVEFEEVPGYYAIASTRDVHEIADAKLLDRLLIGLDTVENSLGNKPESKSFREAVIRNRVRAGLYTGEAGDVTFVGPTLFRASIHFPAVVPVGNYEAEVYMFHRGQLISTQTTQLFIKKFGIGRAIFDFAHKQPVLYGIAAIFVALFAGWIAAMAFRRS